MALSKQDLFVKISIDATDATKQVDQLIGKLVDLNKVVDETNKANVNLNTTVKKTVVTNKEVEKSTQGVTSALSDSNKAFNTGTQSVKGFSDVSKLSFSGIGASIVTLNQGFDLMARGLYTIKSALNSTFFEFVKLEKIVAQITTVITDAEEAQFNFGEEILKLRTKYGANIQDAGTAFYESLSSGAVDAAGAIKLLDSAEKLAIGGVATLADSVGGLTNVLNTYGMTADQATRISDVLFLGAQAGKTTIQQLSKELGAVLPAAKAMGITFEEITSIVSILTAAGISTAESVTAIQSAIVGLQKPTRDLDELLGDMGVSSIKAEVSQKGLLTTLKNILATTDGTAESFARLFARTESMKAICSPIQSI